jgi:YHS domain-containing protein
MWEVAMVSPKVNVGHGPLRRANLGAVVIAWLLCATTHIAIAQVDPSAAEFGGACAMGLAEGKHIQTKCAVTWSADGQTYCFTTEEAKSLFLKDPSANLLRAKERFAAG